MSINAGKGNGTTNDIGYGHIRNSGGHAVTGTLPSSSDAVQVTPMTVPFQQAPGTQSGGLGGPAPTSAARGPRTTKNNAAGNSRG